MRVFGILTRVKSFGAVPPDIEVGSAATVFTGAGIAPCVRPLRGDSSSS